MPTLYLVRHAESAPQPDAPTAAWPLTPRGERQARELAAWFANHPIDAIHSSDYLRAIDMVTPLAQLRGLHVNTHEGLREHAIVNSHVPDIAPFIAAAWRERSLAQPGCESAAQCLDRMCATLDMLVRAAATEFGARASIVASGHGNAIGFFLSHLDARFDHAAWQAMPRPAVYRVNHGDAGWLGFEALDVSEPG